MSAARSVVVVPARDEEARIGACLRALAGQSVGRDAFAVVVVLDGCRDRTAAVVGERAPALGLDVTTVHGPGAGPGWARRIGMDLACGLLLPGAGLRGLIASTDADTRPAPDWLERQLDHVRRGANAIAGLIELDPDESRELPEGVLARRRRDAAARLRDVRRRDPRAAHHHFGGASVGVTVRAYRRVGGIEPVELLEDATFERRLIEHDVPVLRATDVRVQTSARRDGRARRGLAVDLAAASRPGRGTSSTSIEPMSHPSSELWVCRLGVVDYEEALALQERVRAARQAGVVPDTMLLLEHPRVYTRGRRSAPGELSMGEAWYRERGIEIVEVNRGGKVTYHGPGQLVGYPIVAVDDVVAYVRTLEAALVDALHEEGVDARARPQDGPDYTGVWVGERKIASIGVHVARGVTTHGFAVNVDNDLEPFSWVVACGLPGVTMTSLAAEVDRAGPHLSCFAKRAAFAVAQALGRRQRIVTPQRLTEALGALAPA